jgi:hypothetical protein
MFYGKEVIQRAAEKILEYHRENIFKKLCGTLFLNSVALCVTSFPKNKIQNHFYKSIIISKIILKNKKSA